ncbi:hypothetical protein DM02DRAFT_635559 [Periconia macrospinosa]|uniref:Uncharacterized protein n=1 Tax=Periconia macrospinosa TaxID=97972 RepID=A0A2V1D2H1_9PLEO|nr:hypothetical protein DM02DRAFT_635559 [Periconia macrospinosa]
MYQRSSRQGETIPTVCTNHGSAATSISRDASKREFEVKVELRAELFHALNPSSTDSTRQELPRHLANEELVTVNYKSKGNFEAQDLTSTKTGLGIVYGQRIQISYRLDSSEDSMPVLAYLHPGSAESGKAEMSIHSSSLNVVRLASAAGRMAGSTRIVGAKAKAPSNPDRLPLVHGDNRGRPVRVTYRVEPSARRKEEGEPAT